MRQTWILTGVLLLAVAAAPAFAATTGSLEGMVTDSSGAPLPGATVTIESPNLLGGPRVQVTEADGEFAFPALDPGLYTVQVALDSFLTEQRNEVRVRLGRTTDVRVKLQSGEFQEEVVVTAESAVIDPEQVSVSQTFSLEYLEKTSVGSGSRSYQQVIGQAAGVAGRAGSSADGSSNPSVLGSTGGENVWYIDGFNTTDPVTSTFGVNYVFDAIQEISLNTTGYEAEHGNATGGVINVITKSGGNDFSGTFDIRYSDESFTESGRFFDPDLQDEKTVDPSVTFGGPIQRDKLWFFTAFRAVETEATAPGAPTTRTFAGDYYLGKLSYQASPSWRLMAKAVGDPAEIENASFSTAQFRPPEAQRFQEQGNEDVQIAVDGLLSSNLMWDLQAGISRSELNSFPMSGNLELPGQFNVTTGQYSVNYTNAQFSDRDRDEIRSTGTYFLEDFGGDHEFRAGIELSDTFFRSQNFTTGNYSFTRRIVNGNDILRNFTFDPNRDVSEFDGAVQSIFVQDGWNVTPDVTLKLGVRFDEASFDNNLGERTADFDKLQPRLGVAWDVNGDGQTIARASWGRFMHPSALTSGSFARRAVDVLPSSTAWSCNYVRQFTFGLPADFPVDCATLASILVGAFGWTNDIVQEPQGLDPEGWIVSNVSGGAGQPNVLAPGMEATYQDSLVLGVERQIFDRSSIELTYVNKETDDIFEDACNGALGPNPPANHACDFYVMDNLPGLTREYEGVILRFETRAIDWMNLTSSLVWSESKGNVEYTQNAGSDFDYFPDHFVNRFGFLSDHRDWRAKINGFVDLPVDFTLGFDAYWSSDSVFDHTQTPTTAPYGVEYAAPRGSIKGNENYQLDVQIGKHFRIGGLDLELIGAVINLLDDELPIDRCERDSGCTDVQGNSADLGDPIDWQEPRSYEVGFRIEF